MNVVVIGTGYVGLITGLCLSLEHNICCVDINSEIVKNLNAGEPHIYEEGLQKLLNNQLSSNKFKCINFDELDLQEVDLILFCVGTPSLESGECDLSFLKSSIKNLFPKLEKINHPISLVIKSTVPPGTVSSIITPMLRAVLPEIKYPNISLGMNPEFLREGTAINDFFNPDRIVIGYESDISKNHLEKLYDHFDCPKISVSTSCAEMIKYVNNSLLALQISAVNEYANICQELSSVDINDVMKAVLLDKRWQNNQDLTKTPSIHSYLKAGCGFGGSCFPKDVRALSFLANSYNINAPILEGIIAVNESQPDILVKKLSTKLSLKNSKVLLLGISFKPNTDDIRESPVHKFVKSLNFYGAKIYVHDPIAIDKLKLHPTSNFLDDDSYLYDYINHINHVDAIVLITAWDEYSKLPSLLNDSEKIILDTRGFFKATDFNGNCYLKVGLK